MRIYFKKKLKIYQSTDKEFIIQYILKTITWQRCVEFDGIGNYGRSRESD